MFVQKDKHPFVLINFRGSIGPPENFIGPKWVECSHYSTQIADAMDVAEKMKSEGFVSEICIDVPFGYSVLMWFETLDNQSPVENASLPMTICLAALKAKGVEVDGC